MVSDQRLRELQKIYGGCYWPAEFDGVTQLSSAKIEAAAIPVRQLATVEEQVSLGLRPGEWDVPDLLAAVKRRLGHSARKVNREFWPINSVNTGEATPWLRPDYVCRPVVRARGRGRRYRFQPKRPGLFSWWIAVAGRDGRAHLVEELPSSDLPWKWVMSVSGSLWFVSPFALHEWDQRKGAV